MNCTRTVSKILASWTLVLLIVTAAYSQNPASPAQNPQNPPTKTTPPPAATPPTNRANAAATPPKDSDSFLNQAIEINQAEIEIGRLASSKATDNRVKNFATMMVNDHSAGLRKLQSLPGGLKNTVKLKSEHAILKNRLAGLSGTQFDHEYIDAMVSGHREAVGLFEKHADAATANKSAKPSPETQADKAARDLLPTIKKHLKDAESIQKKLSQPAK